MSSLDLKSFSRQRECGFNSRPGHQNVAGRTQDLYRAFVEPIEAGTSFRPWRCRVAGATLRLSRCRWLFPCVPTRTEFLLVTLGIIVLYQGVPLEDVQRLAGHADPRTTRFYDRRDRSPSRLFLTFFDQIRSTMLRVILSSRRKLHATRVTTRPAMS